MVLVHDDRGSDRYYVLHRARAIGVHVVDVDGLVCSLVRSLSDFAEYYGIVWACERVGEVLFVEPYCEDLSILFLMDA